MAPEEGNQEEDDGVEIKMHGNPLKGMPKWAWLVVASMLLGGGSNAVATLKDYFNPAAGGIEAAVKECTDEMSAHEKREGLQNLDLAKTTVQVEALKDQLVQIQNDLSEIKRDIRSLTFSMKRSDLPDDYRRANTSMGRP